jgi:hypothetical protein
MNYTRIRTLTAAALALGLVASPGAASQESKSAPLAKELAQLLDAAKLDSIAAADPNGGFVAALYVPGTQLLVVSGKLASTVGANDRIAKKEYRDLYMDLQGAALPGSRSFAADVSCNGLTFKANGDGAIDSWDWADKSISFSGHKKAKMSEEDYAKVYSEADQSYARILSLLLAQAKPKAGTQ